jgi:hypothetical protein
VATTRADVVVPSSYADLVDPAPFARHNVVTVDDTGLLDALRTSPAELSTMGRGLDDDPVAFLAAAAAGRHAAALL